MICKKCGKKLDDSAAMCYKCFTRIEANTKKPKKKILTIGIIAAVILTPVIFFGGIVAALAVPKAMGASDLAKAYEAPSVMKQICHLQGAYNQFMGDYADGNDPQWRKNIGFQPPGIPSKFVYRTTSNRDSVAIAIFKENLGGVNAGTKVWMNGDGRMFTASEDAQELFQKICKLADE